MLSAGWGPARRSHHNKLYQYHPWQPTGEMKITWARLQGDDIVLYTSTGWPGCLFLKQGAVNQLFLEVSLMFLACLDHKWWAQFHLGILGQHG